MVKPKYWVNLNRVNAFLLQIAIVLLLVSFYACDFNGSKGLTNEGVIEYAITYPDTSNARFDSKMRPEKLFVKFKNKKTLTYIEGLSGAVTLSFINIVDDNLSIVLVKIFNKKLYFTESYGFGEMPLVYSQMPKLLIEPTQDVVEFQNYKCDRSIGSFYGDSLFKFDIISTQEIGVVNPNEKTPYAQINGLLMAFTVKLYGQTMNLKALNVSRGKVSDSDFEIPEDYERVSQETIIEVFNLMQ